MQVCMIAHKACSFLFFFFLVQHEINALCHHPAVFANVLVRFSFERNALASVATSPWRLQNNAERTERHTRREHPRLGSKPSRNRSKAGSTPLRIIKAFEQSHLRPRDVVITYPLQKCTSALGGDSRNTDAAHCCLICPHSISVNWEGGGREVTSNARETLFFKGAAILNVVALTTTSSGL